MASRDSLITVLNPSWKDASDTPLRDGGEGVKEVIAFYRGPTLAAEEQTTPGFCEATPEILRQLLQNLESLDKCGISPIIQPVGQVALHTKGEINLGNVKAKQSKSHHYRAKVGDL